MFLKFNSLGNTYDCVDVLGKWWGNVHQQPVIAVHGWQDNCGTWDTLVPLLSPEVTVLAIDLPGHGFSSHIPAGLAYQATDILFFMKYILRHYGWDKVTLLAHSMGSAQSFIYSSVFPDDVHKYIGIDAFKPLSIDPKKDLIAQSNEVNNVLDITNLNNSQRPKFNYDEMMERAYEKMIAKSVTKDSCKILLRRGMVPAGGGKYNFTIDLRVKATRLTGWTHDHVLELASRIRSEVLLIKANSGITLEKQNVVDDVIEVIRKSARKFEYQEVEGTHHVHLNNPERVAPIINKFLK